MARFSGGGSNRRSRWACGRRLSPAAHAQLGQDVRHVHAGGLGRDEQLGGDLRVRPPGGDQAQHLELPGGQAQPVRRGAVAIAAGAQADPRAAGQRPDLLGSAGARPAGPPAPRRAAAAAPHRRGPRPPWPPRRPAAWPRPARRAGRPGPRLPPRRPSAPGPGRGPPSSAGSAPASAAKVSRLACWTGPEASIFPASVRSCQSSSRARSAASRSRAAAAAAAVQARAPEVSSGQAYRGSRTRSKRSSRGHHHVQRVGRPAFGEAQFHLDLCQGQMVLAVMVAHVSGLGERRPRGGGQCPRVGQVAAAQRDGTSQEPQQRAG